MKRCFGTARFHGFRLIPVCAAFFVLGLCSSIFYLPQAYSAQVTLAWNANTEPTLAGYKIYYGQASRTYGDPVNVGNQTTYSLTLPDLPSGGAYYFAATAYDTAGNESDFSEELVCYAISAEAGPNGTITPEGVFLTEKGASQTFTITPTAGYHIADVLVNGSSVGPVSSYTFTDMQSNQSISASFLPDIVTYTITASAGANGTISPSGTVTVNHGDNKTFTIIPTANYHVEDVKVDGTSVGAVTTYTMSAVTANHTISASFALNTHTITASAGANGAISPSGTVTVNHGDNKTFTIIPTANYHVEDVKVDGTSVGAVTTYTMSAVTANHTISASFALNTCTITASAGANGTISPSGTVTVNHGDNKTFTITPSANYHVEDVKVDGTSVGAVTTYTMSSVTANHTISAAFARDNQPPVADAGSEQVVVEGTEVTLSGLNSTDADDDIVSYHWSQTGGTEVILSDADAAQTTFIAPGVEMGGESLTFKLTVTDQAGLESTDECIVNVKWVNEPPVADAGPAQTVNEWTNVILDGSRSSDPDPEDVLTYLWEQTGGPQVDLSDPTAAQPLLVTPNVGPEGAALTFKLTVTDSSMLQSTDTCIVNVTWVNEPPTASAGPDQTAYAGQTVVLNGSGSSDPDDGIVSYRWTQASGYPVTLSDPTAKAPSFIVPAEATTDIPLEFTLTVTDAGGLQGEDTCQVNLAEKKGPDLTGAWNSYTYDGKTIRSSLKVQNTGNVKAGRFKTSFYLSDDGVTLGKLLSTQNTYSLNPAQTVSLSFSYSSKTNLSRQYVIAVIDSANQVQEVSEKNNRAVSSLLTVNCSVKKGRFILLVLN